MPATFFDFTFGLQPIVDFIAGFLPPFYKTFVRPPADLFVGSLVALALRSL